MTPRERLIAILEDAPLAFAYLFGSRARGDAREQSDFDVAVHWGEACAPADRARAEWQLVGRLTAALPSPVDLVCLDTAGPLLRHRVLRDGSLLCCRDDRARVAFVTQALREYDDAIPAARFFVERNRKRWMAARG